MGNQRMRMASCPSSPSLRECAPLKSKFSQARLLRVNTGLQPSTSHIFGESDEPNSQEISRFIQITFRDRGRSIFCKIDFQEMQISILVAWLRQRGNQVEGKQHQGITTAFHFLVALVKSSCPFLVKIVLKIIFEYQIILKDLKIHYVKFM